MKTVIALLLSLVAYTAAFTSVPPSVGVGKAVPRLSNNAPSIIKQHQARDKDAVVLNNALREFANWNDVWDDGYGYGGYGGGMGGGMYGPYRGVYRRGPGGRGA